MISVTLIDDDDDDLSISELLFWSYDGCFLAPFPLNKYPLINKVV